MLKLQPGRSHRKRIKSRTFKIKRHRPAPEKRKKAIFSKLKDVSPPRGVYRENTFITEQKFAVDHSRQSGVEG